MLTEDGPRVLEFNCRFGDPETESILPRVESDLLPLLWGAATGELDGELALGEGAAVTVVLAGDGYPERSDSGTPIEGVDDAEAAGALIFHAGTTRHSGQLVTNGGRVLAVTAAGDDVAAARGKAYEAVRRISFAGMRFRRDIAQAAAEEHVRG
jgi:phosphoribosylamine--glycine ligase